MILCITPLFVVQESKNMSKYYSGIILRVYPGSLAEELELVPGDKILEINGQGLRDIIDLSFAMADEEIDIAAALIEVVNGDLPPVDVQPAYDPHRDLLKLHHS